MNLNAPARAPMTVLFLTDSYRPYVSGVVRSVETTVAELARRGVRVILAVPAYPPGGASSTASAPSPAHSSPLEADRPRSPTTVPLPSVRAPGVAGFRIPLPTLSPILGALAREGLKPDIIHVHSPFVSGTIGLRLRRRTGAPVVFTHHTLYHEYAHYGLLPTPLVSWATLRRVARFCRRVDHVVAPSRAVEAMVRSLYRCPAPVTVIPTGLPLEPFHHAPRGWLKQALGIPASQPVVLHVGRLAREKSPATLLEALRIILESLPQAHAVIAGGGPLEGWVREQARRLDPARTHLVGPVPPDAVSAYYAGADLFITASTTETQGLVAIEAMAAGLPVVAPDAFGMRDAVLDSECGYLTAPRAEALAQAAIRLLQDPDARGRMARAARRRAQEFDVERTVGQLLDLYARLLPTGAPGAPR